VLVSEQKLAVEVAQVDCVEVDNVDFAKARLHEVFEQLAADAASAHHQHARLSQVSTPLSSIYNSENYLLNARLQTAADALARMLVAPRCRHN
jgi:hypothetical protein